MRLRLGLAVVGGMLVLAGVCAGGLWKARADVYTRRDARIAALAGELDGLRAREQLTAAEACAIAEAHLLTRPVGAALAVACDAPVFEARGPRAGRLTGAVRASSLENALLGGGFAEPLCLARSAAGWAVVGSDFELPDCAIDVPEDAPDAAAVTRAATTAVSDGRRATALATLESVRSALTTEGAVPDTCAGLPKLAHPALATLSDGVLAGRPVVGHARSFGFGMAGCVTGEGECGLHEAPTWVLLFDTIREERAMGAGEGTYVGGTWAATAKLVEVGPAAVRCARPIAFALPETVLITKHSAIQVEYDKGVKRAVCAEVEALGAGQLALDPWWEC